VLIALVAVGRVVPIKEAVSSFVEWVRTLGGWGPVVFAALYAAACVLMVPGSALTLGAGVLFGVVVGTITVSIASTLGACAAFWLGRTLAREWVAGKVAGHPRFAAIDAAVGEEGFKIVLLTRLSPVFPFNLLNYALGLTRVSFRSYALASWIGMLPATILVVTVGSSLGSIARITAERAERTGGEWIFFWAGLAAALVAVIFVGRVAKRALARAGAAAEETP